MKKLMIITLLFCISIFSNNELFGKIGINNSSKNYTNKKSNINLSKAVSKIGKPENLGSSVNSKYNEIGPVISPDGKTLYFERKGDPNNYTPESHNIWFAEMDKNGKFKQAKNIGKPLNNVNSPSSVWSVLPDGNSMLVNSVYNSDETKKNGVSGASITYKQYNSTWSIPEKIVIEDYYNNSDYISFYLAYNGRILLHTEVRNEGYGDQDLYVSFLQSDGTWSKPKNLGPDINTAKFDYAPFLASDGVTLYFASDGHPGYGLVDIFVSRRLDDSWQKWSEPVNLGPNINTKNGDSYFTITASGDYAYFSSINIDNSDIYRIKLPAELRPNPIVLVNGKVINKKTNKPIGTEIIYEKLSTGEIMGSARSNPETGEYKIALPAKERYSFRAEAEDFISVNENLNLMNLNKYSEINRDLYLVPIEEGQIVRINNVFFNTAESNLLPDSYPELKRLVKILKNNPNMSIKLLGHTDNIGKRENNLKLSSERAEAVKKYIISLGINENRIITEGYGPDKPVSTNTTKEGKALNRRVEFQIINY